MASKTMVTSEQKKSKGGSSAIFVPAGLFVGIGFGFIFNNLPAGATIGLGLGFALFASFMLGKK